MWIAIEYSYKLGQQNEFKFLCKLRMLVFAETVTYLLDDDLLSKIFPNAIIISNTCYVFSCNNCNSLFQYRPTACPTVPAPFWHKLQLEDYMLAHNF